MANPQRPSGKKSRSGSRRAQNSNVVLIGMLAGGGVGLVGIVIAYFAFGRGDSGTPATAVSTQPAATTPVTMTPSTMPTTTPISMVPQSGGPVMPMTTPTALTTPTVAAPVQGLGTPSVASNSTGITPQTPDPSAQIDKQKVAQFLHAAAAGEVPEDDLTPEKIAASVTSKAADSDAPAMSYPDMVEKVDRSVVRINVVNKQGPSIGSGFVTSDSGIVVTNYHVIEGAEQISVEFEDKRECGVAGFLMLDHTRDIVVIQLDDAGKPFVPITLSPKLPRKGEEVAAFGAPLGLDFTASKGTVTNVRDGKQMRMKGTYIQTDTPISPGNSGGPLVNMSGQVVGMNTFQLSIGQNLNFAISIDDIQEVLAMSSGKSVQKITPDSVPIRMREREVDTSKPPGLVDLTGTERADKLLAQMDQSFVIVKPFEIDPSGRINEFMIDKLKKTLKTRLKVELTRITKLPDDQPVIVLGVMFDIPEDEKLQERGACELSLQMYVIMLDVDKDGKRVPSVVWREKARMANLSINALAEGNLTNSVKDNAQKFFDKFSNNVNKARKAHGGGGK